MSGVSRHVGVGLPARLRDRLRSGSAVAGGHRERALINVDDQPDARRVMHDCQDSGLRASG